MAECEGYHVVLDCIELAIAHNASVVEGDTARLVFVDDIASQCHVHTLPSLDAVDLRALGGAEGCGVVAVGDVGRVIVVAGESRAVVCSHSLDVVESNEAIVDVDGLGIAFPSYEAAIAFANSVLL